MGNILRNWKTTLAGIGTLVLAGATIANHPTALLDPQTLATIAAGVGLILGKDASVTGAVH